MANLMELIKLRGYTQRNFERAAGLSENRISKWKNGQGEPSLLEGVRMAELLKISLEDLAGTKKAAISADDLTDDERLLVRFIRETGLSSGDVMRGFTGRSVETLSGVSVQMKPPRNRDASGDNEPSADIPPSRPGRVS